MPASKCPVCDRSRGRRDCLLKNGALICSMCCAEMRAEETCSECSHFETARKHEVKKDLNKKVRPFTFELRPDLEEAVDQALILLENGKLDEAEVRIDELVQEDPDYHLVLYAKGCLLAKQNHPAESVPCFEQAVRIYPYFVEAWANLSLALVHTLQIGRAVEAAQEVMKLAEPESPIYKQAKNTVTIATQQARKDGLSLKNYFKGAEIFNKAHEFMDQGDFGRARDGFWKSHAINPRNASTLGNLGLCYAYLGEKVSALEALDQALEVDPEYEPARLNRLVIEKLGVEEALSTPHITINDPLKKSPSISWPKG